MWVLFQDGLEEGRASRQYELVCLDLPGPTTDGAVKEILLLPESQTNAGLKIISEKTKLFILRHFSFCLISLKVPYLFL